MFVNQTVSTPYGVGKVLEVRADGKVVVRPTQWYLANNQTPTFYMNPNDVKPFYTLNEKVSCSFGVGTIIECRDVDGIYVITLENWKLANDKSPTLYLNEQSFKKYTVNTAAKVESSFSFANVYKKAVVEKELAKELYGAQNFMEAKFRYGRAVEVLRDIAEEMTNEEKGRYFEMSVTCNSNLALCSWGLSDWNDCVLFGRNSLTLVDALESKMGDSQIWDTMIEKGIMTLEKMKDLKGKAYRIIGKAELKRKRYEEAKSNLKAALSITSNEKMQKELSELLADATKKLAQLEKKEKTTWQKAFSKGSKGQGDLYTSTAADDNSTKSTPVSPVALPKEVEIKKEAKKESNELKEDDDVKDMQVWKNDSILGPFIFMGVLGGLGALAYWWTRRTR